MRRNMRTMLAIVAATAMGGQAARAQNAPAAPALDAQLKAVLDAAAKRVKMRELLVSAARSAVPRLLQKR